MRRHGLDNSNGRNKHDKVLLYARVCGCFYTEIFLTIICMWSACSTSFSFVACRVDVLRALLPVEFCYAFLFNLLHLSLSLALVTTAILMTMAFRTNGRCQFFHRLPQKSYVPTSCAPAGCGINSQKTGRVWRVLAEDHAWLRMQNLPSKDW